MTNKMSTIRVRIAPSPTGNLHLGTARTAIFNYLFARTLGGTFILRIEDTDLERSDKKFEENIFKGLGWLGIVADESPEKGGDFGPYRQSERRNFYKKSINFLLDSNSAFLCFHSEKELEMERHKLMEAKAPPVHWCEFRNLDYKEAKELSKIKTNYLIRFKTEAGRIISFDDKIRGKIEFSTDNIGDFSLAKSTDVPLYNFAVVVDDLEMKITHCIRGEDHIPNTPKQILIFNALGAQPPIYAHLPLILGPDRTKLSKRHGAKSVMEYRDDGFLADALFNFLALLGWNGGEEKEIYSKDELIKKFSIQKVQKSPAVFDLTKLEWMNGEYIKAMPDDQFAELALPFISKFKTFPKENLLKIISLEKTRAKKLSDLDNLTSFFFHLPDYDSEILYWKNMKPQEAKENLNISLGIIRKFADSSAEDIGVKLMEKAIEIGDRGKILWPLRAALSGRTASPGPFDIISAIGVQETINRIERALKKISL